MSKLLRLVPKWVTPRGVASRCIAALVSGWVASSGQAHASADQSAICDQVAWQASQDSGVPVSVLKAISLTETGRKHDGGFRPWPWTVKIEGKGVWFDTEDEARSYVFKEYKRGARSFGVGCFQIDYKSHGHEFASIDEMFDPLKNALYAAKLLKELHAETGSWSNAAGAYHSRTPEEANDYSKRFETFRGGFSHEDGDAIPEIPDIVLAAANDGNGGYSSATGAEAVMHVNQYPLLQTGETSGLGSLVPMGNAPAASLFAPTADAETVAE